jgi:hypothetical protein
MPTSRSTKRKPVAAPASTPSPRKTVGLTTVLSELQFFITLRAASQDDDRIPALANDLIHDFLDSMRAIGFTGGDDLPEQKTN